MVQSNQQIPFPWKLHEMLEDCEKKGLSHIVSWLPDNRSLRVHDPPAFTSKVIGKYFKQTKYKSFQRQLNIWGFQRIIKGPNKGGYTHVYFVRSKESLCFMMSRQKIKGEKPSRPRHYFPVDLEPPSRKNNGCDDIRNRSDCFQNGINLTNQSCDGMSGSFTGSSKIKQSINSFFKNSVLSDEDDHGRNILKGMVPSTFTSLSALHSNSTPNPAILPEQSNLNCDSVSKLSRFQNEKGNPKTFNSLPWLKVPECTTTSLSVASDFVNNYDTSDETLSFNSSNVVEMNFPSPDPIAPNHPLSNRKSEQYRSIINSRSMANFDYTASNKINAFAIFDSNEQQNSSLFAGRSFFTLGEHLDRRSSLGAENLLL